MSDRRMLLAFAHPDDESFGLGAVIARYVKEGAQVSLVCTTNGDVGTIPPEMQDQFDTIADLRLSELDCAAARLGLHKVYKLGYKDSGMMGSESMNDPQASWSAWRNDPDELIKRIVVIIRTLKPQVVVTFNEYGGYGHPDHIVVHHATAAAFDKAGDPDYDADSLPPYQPKKLYYTNIPTFMIRIGILLTRLRGQDPRRIGVNKDIDLVAILDHVEPVHAKIDIRGYLKDWDEANACHASQGGGRSGFLPRWLRKLLGPKQGFTRVFPAPEVDRVDEDDLFAGIDTSH